MLGNRLWAGVSTDTLEQARKADVSEIDYFAAGGESERNLELIGGLEAISAVRRLTSKPLVAM